MSIIEPKTLPGFLELLPEEQIEFNRIYDTIRKNYERAGFVPLDTPLLEYEEIILAKAGGETEKQIYRFKKGDTDLALRFDLTVPLAKYVALYFNQLSFPFKRYQIGKAFRGEKPQKGRFREFYQADIDIIGDGELSIMHDAEIPSIIYKIFKELDFGKFTIRINNRKVLNGFFAELLEEEKAREILRIVDKIDKIGKEAVALELQKLRVEKENVEKICSFVLIKGTNEEMILRLESLGIKNEQFTLGLLELKNVIRYATLLGVPESHLNIDLTIARGLDYYTGTVYETTLDEHRDIGSICSGGRYENLAEYYTTKKLPGVGISIGLSRLFYKLMEMRIVEPKNRTMVDALIIPMGEEALDYSMNILKRLREKGGKVCISYDKKGIKQNLNYANKQNIPYVLIIGETEMNTNLLTFKNMREGTQEVLSIEDIIKKLS